MRNSASKVWIVMLTVMVVFSAFSGSILGSDSAFAAGTGDFSGDGSSGSPYLIGTADELNKVRDAYLGANLYFKLTATIDLSIYSGTGWKPIGDENTPFQGHMDGNGYKITGLTINKMNDDNIGLFGRIDTVSSLTNMKLENVSLNGMQFVGGLAGYNDGGTITNSYASGTIGGTYNIGGLVGYNADGKISTSYALGNVSGNGSGTFGLGGLVGNATGLDGTISNSYAKVDVSGGSDSSVTGGLVGGMSDGKISGSYALGNVSGGRNSKNVGGLIGESTSATISNSYTTGNVNGSTNVGGLVGNESVGGDISNSYTIGNVSGGESVGGLVGRKNRGTISGSYASGEVNASSNSYNIGGLVGENYFGKISDSYAAGKVSGGNNSFYVGGLVGWNGTADISNSYASGDMIGNSDNFIVGGLVGGDDGNGMTTNSFYDTETTGQSASATGIGIANALMKNQSTYEADHANSWDFANTWAIDSLHNSGYPYLRAIQVYIDYDGNGNTGGTVPPSLSYMPGATVSLYSGTLDVSKTGYVFDGWNTLANGNGSAYKPGDSYTITSHTTFYAKWKTAGSSIATLTSTIGTVSTGGTANESIANIPYGTTLAALKASITPDANATFEIYEADGTTVATTLTSGNKVIVTAQDGITKVPIL